MTLSAAERSRYQRHLTLPEVGLAGQEKLKAARVLVMGAGGLGSPSALYLAASGVGTLGLLDFDRIDLSNLQRQVLYDTAQVGRSKALTARERLQALNPDIEIIAHDVELRPGNAREIFANYDVVLDGTDRLGTRYLVNDACVLLRKPLVSAAIHRFEGQVMTYVPERGPCYRCLFPEAADGIVPNCADAGVLGVLPGVLGTIQATEAIKLILGVGEPLIGRLLTYDAMGMRFQEFRLPRREDCPVCGVQPTITELREAPAACAADVRRLAPRTLQDWLTRPPADGAPLVVDVRAPREFAAGHIAGAVNIPVHDLPQRLSDLPPGVVPVFVCRSGARSLAACGIASNAGIAAPAHLEGGMLAWAAEVDPSIEVAPA